MALPTICINSGTGSDTTASGDNTAVNVNGVLAASHTNTTVNITDAVALGSVPVDGSAVLKLFSSSGRKFSKITAISGSSGNWTVTVADAYANTESGKSWAIGGKLATWGGNLQLNSDVKGGWTIDVQTGETITADLTISATGTSAMLPLIITSTTYTPGTWGSQPIIQTATSGVAGININSFNIILKGINFKCTVGSPTSSNVGICAKSSHSASVNIQSCIFDGWYHGIDNDNGVNFGMPYITIADCEVKNCTHYGMNFAYISQLVLGCHIHNNTLGGVAVGGTTANSFAFSDCVIVNNTGPGIKGGSLALSLCDCTIAGNGASGSNGFGGLNLTLGVQALACRNSIFWNNGSGSGATSAGVANIGGANSTAQMTFVNCAFGGSNQLYSVTDGASATDIISQFSPEGTQTLSVSPFVSSSDWTLNATAGGGANCHNLGAKIPNGSATALQPDMGAIPIGGGLGASTDPGIANVKAGTAYQINGASLTGTLAASSGGTSKYQTGRRTYG